ncbi:MAG: HAD-IA family hydrolase [Nitrospirae bacterium]|nr:HAD-IA family hydrolase [Nitrospirota bacterium]
MSIYPLIPAIKDIKFVLLDMDGTLLDRYFDDYFWEHLVPEKYAEKHNITFGKAKEDLLDKYRVHEGTLNWTDLDFWSRELDLDIPALKEQIKHLIEVHPHVEDFLKMLKKRRKKVFLVTNAHYKAIDLKLKKTHIGRYFDSVLSSFDAGYPKESIEFWREAERRLGFDKEKTLFIDDTEEVLRTAKRYGIKYIFYKVRANSKIKPGLSKDFLHIFDFNELIKRNHLGLLFIMMLIA